MINKDFFVKNKTKIFVNAIGVVLGLTGGYLYYHFYACNQGCPLNSSPLLTMLWGGILGYLVSDMFKAKPKEA